MTVPPAASPAPEGGGRADGVRVRAAGPMDLAAVAALERDALGSDAWSQALVERGLAGQVPTVAYRVAEVDDVVVGHLVVSVVGDVSELQRVAVDAGHRRGGVGGLLVAEAVALASSGGSERLLLEVRTDNTAAIALYERHGFVEVARRRRYYRDGATAVVMQRDLV